MWLHILKIQWTVVNQDGHFWAFTSFISVLPLPHVFYHFLAIYLENNGDILSVPCDSPPLPHHIPSLMSKILEVLPPAGSSLSMWHI